MSDVSSERPRPNCDLLDSIAHNTKRIGMIDYAEDTSSFLCSDSSPAIATMSNVHQILSSHQRIFLSLADSNDYGLCCALAALLSNVYRITDLAETSSLDNQTQMDKSLKRKDGDEADEIDGSKNIYHRLCNRMSIIRHERISICTASCASSSSLQGLADLWSETDRLMDAVYRLASSTTNIIPPPPSYHELFGQDDDDCKRQLPSYDQTVPLYDEKTQKDLDTLLSAIDRLGKVAPRLNDQRVEISDRQAGELAAAMLGKAVERLSRGRMDDQRAALAPTKTKEDMLYDLMAQVYDLASRTFDNQRVLVGSRLQRKMDEAAMFGILDRFERGRMTSQVCTRNLFLKKKWCKLTCYPRLLQDWAANETSSFHEISRLTEMLIKSLHCPKFIKQRFRLSSKKERDLFMTQLYSKVNRMQNRRLENQDAAKAPVTISSKAPSPSLSREQEQGQEQFFQWLQSMQKSRLLDQRASLPTNMACPLLKHNLVVRS